MSSNLYSRLVLRALIAAAAAIVPYGALAQAVADHDHDHANAAGERACGYLTFNDGGERAALARTAISKPDVFQRMQERAKSTAARYVQGATDEYIFVVRNRTTGEYDEVQATLVYFGRRARIWIDNADLARIKAATITALARGLDSITPASSRNPTKSIIENDEEVFGKAPPNKFDPATPDVQDFLLTDIKDNLSGAFVGGFFSPWDQTENSGSNKMNLLYIDSKEGLGNQSSSYLTEVLNTMAHEFQHLIHYNTNSQSETVFNEGCSEVASIINGYRSRDNRNYLRNTNIPFLTWNGNDGTKVLIDYERAMTFVHYMSEQCGERFLTALNSTKTMAMDRVADALRQIGDSRDWKDLYSSWVAANYLGTFTDPYRYKVRLSTAVPTSHGSYSAPFPDSASISVQQFASAYLVFNNPGAIKVRFRAGQPIRVMAMLYKGSSVVEVWQLENDMEYTIGTYAKYDKIVFGIANLSFNGQTVRWNLESVTLGVDEAATAGGLAITSVTPNPTNGPFTVNFTAPSVGVAKIQLYDLAGTLVRTVDAGRIEAGAHEITLATDGLASGTYLVRISQGARSVSRQIVLAR